MKERWFEAFRRNPNVAVSDLFTGRTSAGSDTRLDVPELLHQWFPRNLTDDRSNLDGALLRCLCNMRDDYASLVKRIGFLAYGKRVGDALIALQLLDLPQARGAIRADLGTWLRWLSPLRLAPERDPALECYRLLTQDQPDASHMTMWLRLAADQRPEYLTVALAGLQRLPNGADARKNQKLMLRALLRHAMVRFHDVNGAHRFFNRSFAAVRGRFPRTPQHWNGVLDDALDGFQGYTGAPAESDLTHLLRTKRVAKQQRPSSRRRILQAPVEQAEWSALLKEIRESKREPDALAKRLFEISDRNHDYALATGDSYAFARTLSNLGSALLVHHALGAADMTRFGTMIERALVWEPANSYCWMLWAKWFQAQDRREPQEAVLRETLRMFPHDTVAQVELARLLIVDGEERWDEAEHYLHRTINHNPDSEHAHVVMARLLVLRGRPEDAESLLAELLHRNPNGGRAQEALKRLQAGDQSEAPMLLDHGPSEPAQDQTGLWPLQEVLRRGGLAGEFNQVRIAGQVNGQTKLIKQESRKGDALAGFYSQWLRLPNTPDCPPYAWAWAACLQWQQEATADAWEQLAKHFPEAARETYFLRALAWPGSSNGAAPQHLHSEDGSLTRPIDTIMRDGQALLTATNLDQRKRDDFACSLMACAAIDTPEFSMAQ